MVRFCIKVNKAKGLGTELPIGNIRQNELVMCSKGLKWQQYQITCPDGRISLTA